ncbi:MAG TPA: hypothetical protein VFX51_30235 [Solirubrobacteraceae bacterium]|nr:hypothetical protein [Solirubrobacteraceae bacterium]
MRRPSAPLVISVIALFAALGGTSYAAAKITGSEIAKKTIKGGNVATKTLSGKKMKLDTLGGDQINESKLGPVPKADHATAADTATSATNAAGADTLDGIDSAGFMLKRDRAFEVNASTINNFGSGAPLVTISDLPGGTYVVMAKLTYDNDGGTAAESCTLHVPGSDDTTSFVVTDTESLTMQEVTTSSSSFSAYVSCTGDGNDDTYGISSLIANRVD